MKEQYILKQRLQELIGTAKVTAALFYTFNFDPKFFENYIMPLLLPEETFHNNAIHNNVQWRKLYNEKKVPPITVYCDQYAKSLEAGPMLDYRIIEVNMPSLGRNKGNFHPKQCFILIEENGEQSLIMITGSNNITQGGWCENKECVSEIVLSPSAFFPDNFKKKLQSFLEKIVTYYSNGFYNPAEKSIWSYLNKKEKPTSKRIYFYDSFQSCFEDFLQNHVSDFDKINLVEVISPFFSNDTTLVQFFKEKKIKLNIQAPILNGNCMLDEQVYDLYIQAGVVWYQAVFKEGELERNVHSKVYRLYSNQYVYTFIGSVNFTKPAWCGVWEKAKEVYNIESGVLYVDKREKDDYLLKKMIKEKPSFISVPESEIEIGFERKDAPTINFTIDWVKKTISWKAKQLKNKSELILPTTKIIDLNITKEIDLQTLPQSSEIIKSLSRHSILEVREIVNGQSRTHYYYPNQIGFEQKPIEFRFSATDILDAWDLLYKDDHIAKEWLATRLEQLTEKAQDESGRIVQDVSEQKSLLNEMARHLYGLVQLEKYLFDPSVLKSPKQIEAHWKSMQYYLAQDNVDTLINYIKDIQQLYESKRMLGGYYWVLLSIIKTNIYGNKQLKTFLNQHLPQIKSYNTSGKEERKKFKILTEKNITDIEDKLQYVNSQMDVEKKKITWALESLTYGNT